MASARAHDSVTAFARAYELDDFDALARRLAVECVWAAGHVTRTGARAIVETLRREAERRRRWFDELRREVRVEPLGATRAALFVTEYMMKVPALWHRRHLQLEVEADAQGAITRVVERSAPAEAEAYERFLAACGVAREED